MQNLLLFCIRPFLVSELVCPVGEILLGGVCLEDFSFDELCSLAAREKCFIGLADTAAAGGGKWNDGLACQIMTLQEGIDDRGCNIPPDPKGQFRQPLRFASSVSTPNSTSTKLINFPTMSSVKYSSSQIGRTPSTSGKKWEL